MEWKSGEKGYFMRANKMHIVPMLTTFQYLYYHDAHKRLSLLKQIKNSS